MAAAWQEQLDPGLWVPLGAAGAAAQPGTVRLCEQDTPCSSSTTALGSSGLHCPARLAWRFLPADFHPLGVPNSASAVEQGAQSRLELPVTPSSEEDVAAAVTLLCPAGTVTGTQVALGCVFLL